MAEHKKACDLWQRGKRNIALKKHEKACQLSPNNPVFLRHYAFALMQVHEPAKSAQVMLHALDCAWREPSHLIDTCVTARSAQLYDLIYNFLTEKKLPDPIKYFYADALDRRGMSADALSLIQTIPEPKRLAFPFLQLLFAQLLVRNKQYAEAKSVIDTINTEQLPTPLQAELHYTRASIHDKLNAPTPAFQELRQAKALLLKQQAATPTLAQQALTLNRAILPISAKESTPAPNPPVILCGHPRSGTTLIEQVLDSHPSVLSVEEQDCFFSQVATPLHTSQTSPLELAAHLTNLTDSEISAYKNDYLEKLHRYLPEPNNKRVVDKFPDLSTTLGLYRKVVPEGKMIIALRDPRDVVLSCYFQNLPLNPASAPYLQLKSAAEKYIATIQCWLESKEHFTDGWIETRYEDWVHNTEKEAKRVLSFLELDWDPTVLSFHTRHKTVSSPTYADVAQPIYTRSIGRWQHYQKQLDPILDTLDPICQQLGYST
ncbi:sulfotransferase family protein [Rubritalea tangerina]|uniref:sulfotransferase family protein n=1 Tax=Rubritalea tangerina TaxID=430798 RepID=UPI00360909CC